MTVNAALRVDPAYANYPKFKRTLGPEVADLAALAGFPPDESQELALNVLFGLDARGNAAAFEFALIEARQNGKSGLFKMAALGWLFVMEQRLIIWSAHEMNTTKEAFRDLADLVENCPSLSRRLAPGRVNGIFRGNGDEAIELATGARIKFKARTHGGGRGLTGDKVILDEAMFLKKEHMGSLLPTLSARPDPQVVYGGSAGMADSEVLRGIRDRGRAGGDPSLAYIEFCAPEGGCAEELCSHDLDVEGCALDDMDRIRLANPALDARISREYIRAERRALPPLEFARERLGWWDRPLIDELPLIDSQAWGRLTDPGSEPLDPVAFGVYVSLGRTRSAIGVCGRRADGKLHVGVVPAVRGKPIDSLPGTAWIPDRVAELVAQWKPCAVVVDGHSAAASLISSMETLSVEVTRSNASDLTRACGALYDAVVEDDLRHQGAQPLGKSVTSARKRDLVDAWVWDRKDQGADLTQLMSVTLALHGLMEHAPQVVEPWALLV